MRMLSLLVLLCGSSIAHADVEATARFVQIALYDDPEVISALFDSRVRVSDLEFPYSKDCNQKFKRKASFEVSTKLHPELASCLQTIARPRLAELQPATT